MYIKVHKKGNRWFRNDIGTLVGEEVPEGPQLENLKILYGDHIIVSKSKNKYKVIYHGYFDENGHFFRFCRRKTCKKCLEAERKLSCPKSFADNPCKSATGGYYIKTT